MAIRKRSARNVTKGPKGRPVDLGIGGWKVPLHSHISYLWNSDQEFVEAVGFLELGIRRQEHCLLVGTQRARTRILDALRERQVDLERLRAAGRLTLLDGAASADDFFDSILADFEQAVSNGASLIRCLGIPGWGEEGWPDNTSLLSFEGRVTDLAREFPCVILCPYDVRTLPVEILERGGFEQHPLVITGGQLVERTRSVPPAAFVMSVAHAVRSAAGRKRAEAERDRLLETATAAREQAEAALERLRAIQSITDSAVVHSNLDAMLQELLVRLRRALNAEHTMVLLIDEDQMLYPRAVEGQMDQSIWLLRIPLGKGVSGRIAQTGQPAIVSDLSTVDLSGVVGIPPPEVMSVARSMMAAPLQVEGKIIGVVNVSSATHRRFTQDDLELLLLVADRAAPAVELARLWETVRTAHDRLEALSRRLVEVQETERAEIARELHDEVGQLLTGLRLMVEAGESGSDAHGGGIRKTVNELIARVRDLSVSLRPPMLDALGLLPALLWQIERFEAQSRIHVAFHHANLDRRFSPAIETAAFRIVQEALTNVARHAGV